MRQALALAALTAALTTAPAAHALDPAVEIGVSAGVLAADQLDQINTSWIAQPRLGFWFVPQAGLELDVGLSTGNANAPGHGFFVAAPRAQFVGNPLAGKGVPVMPLLTVGVGAMIKQIDDKGVRGADYAGQRVEALASFGGGLLIPIVGPLHFRADAQIWLTVNRETEFYSSPFVHFVGTAGLSVRFGLAKDADKDKVPDKDDLCPNDPEDRDGFEDSDGCPDPDNDNDGIPDTDDACVDQAEDLDGFEDTDGCPEDDNDKDGILDDVDVCPDDAGPKETGGCPDADGDGIADKDDRCPEAAGLADLRGCPDTDADGLADLDDECPTEAGGEASFGCPDQDGDRVPDVRDACPDKAAPEGIDPMRSDGCPSRVYVTLGEIKITEQVFFANGKATIRSNSFGLLDDIASVLNKYPEIVSVQVEGHTDDRGNDASNLTLSQARAESVVSYLVDKGGVDAGRLVAKGFGETAPIASNDTADGRAQNRRVAFTILEQQARKATVFEGEEDTVVDEAAADVEALSDDAAPATAE